MDELMRTERAAGARAGDGQASGYRPWLHRYAMLVVVATFVLVASGGNVTSRDAGLAVPDGFTVFGHFLWLFPMDQWVGNIFHEHIHRLKGSAVGLLAIGLCVWLWRTQRHRRWLQWLGVGVLALVIAQGVMGGLRVEFARWYPAMETPFRVLHAVVGQLFLCLTVVVAVVTSRLWHDRAGPSLARERRALGVLRGLCFVLLGTLLLQLVLGAVMRHTGSGLAIPDFPASYGQIVPPLSEVGIRAAMDEFIPYDAGVSYYQPGQVAVAYAHRVWAIAVVLAAVLLLSRTGALAKTDAALRVPSLLLAVLLVVQVALGAMVIWTGRHHDTATAHQALGAAVLAVAVWLTLRVHLAGPAVADRVAAPNVADEAAPVCPRLTSPAFEGASA